MESAVFVIFLGFFMGVFAFEAVFDVNAADLAYVAANGSSIAIYFGLIHGIVWTSIIVLFLSWDCD